MIRKRGLINKLKKALIGGFFGFISLFSLFSIATINPTPVYADEVEETVVTEESTQVEEPTSGKDECRISLGGMAWLGCTVTKTASKAVDTLYGAIEDLLVIEPIVAEDGEPIYEVWKYLKGITNIVFIIFLLVVIYSQITGIGLANYEIKKILPKLIIAAVLMNLSFLICQIAVDVSNVVGGGLRGVFTMIEEKAGLAYGDIGSQYSFSAVFAAASGATVIGGGVAAAIAISQGMIWMLIPAVLGALVAAVSGLITIGLRHAVVAMLAMIAPLAMVAYMLPNTEQWFKKWKDLLYRMLIFYPMFSLLFGASHLVGMAMMVGAKNGFWLVLGMIVQVFPLFFSWKLMSMSGTILSGINAKIRGLADKPLAANRAWADSHRAQTKANKLANGITPSAKLLQYLDRRRALREIDTKNALDAAAGKASLYVQKKIANSEVGDVTGRSRRTSRYTRNAKAAKNQSLMAQNAMAHTEHALNKYSDYFDNSKKDKALAEESTRAWLDYGRAQFQKELDEENDINFLTDQFLKANKRDKYNRIADPEAFNRYIRSVAGPDGEERLLAKIVKQAATVESKQKAEYAVMLAKWGLNGYNKREFRSFAVGYRIDDDGWAVDKNGERLKIEKRDENGTVIIGKDGKPEMENLELVQGDAILKAPEKLVFYDKRDSKGLYFDFRDQEGNVVARIHRGTGEDGGNHDNAAFMKEVFTNWDIPISDPINNVYGILSGVKPGDIKVPGGEEIGLSRYSTTIGRAMSNYKGDASWAGAMFNTGIGNRQIQNSAQYAIWVLDSIKKTLKPGGFNTQNPASVAYLRTILDPNNWDKIFTEEAIKGAVNINNEGFGGEKWVLNDEGNIEEIIPVDNPTYEQRMNTIKRKLIFPALQKILPSFDRLRTSNTADNQKPGTADEQYKLLKMIEEEYENNSSIPFDPTLVDMDLQTAARDFRSRKRDKYGNLIYHGTNERDSQPENLLAALEDAYHRSLDADELKSRVFEILNKRPEYSVALAEFNEFCELEPDATMNQIYAKFTDLDRRFST